MAKDLISGYKRFQAGYFAANQEKLEKLANGQSPRVAVLACCDSRVDPMIIFDADPGDLFVIRNVANLIPPKNLTTDYHSTIAALEFAVSILQVKDLVILGHHDCGGLKALINHDPNKQDNYFIDKWMALATPVKDKILSNPNLTEQAQRYLAAEQEAIKLSLKNIMTYDWVASRVAQGKLNLHGWHYALKTGTLSKLDSQTEQFVAV